MYGHGLFFTQISVTQIQESVNKYKPLAVRWRCYSLTFISRESALIEENSKFQETCHLATCYYKTNPYIRTGRDAQIVQSAPRAVDTAETNDLLQGCQLFSNSYAEIQVYKDFC